MTQSILATAVFQLAQTALPITDTDLGQPYTWLAHKEGLRFALIGSCHELHTLALELHSQRPTPITPAQRLLGQLHTTYRQIQATLLGINDEMLNQTPAPGEWSLRHTLRHIIGAQHYFYSLVSKGVTAYRHGEEPGSITDEEVGEISGGKGFWPRSATEPMSDLLAYYDQLHGRTLTEFATLTATELDAPSPLWWEGESYSLAYRLLRMDAHAQQHLLQLEKCLLALQQPPNEARRWAHNLLQALAAVEQVQLGLDDWGTTACTAVAQTITQRIPALITIPQQARELETAVKTGDLPTIQTLCATNPSLVNALDSNGLSLVLTALYHNQKAAADALITAGAHLNIHAAAAIGNLERVQTIVADWSPLLEMTSRDGFRPLALACFFGQEATALWLIEQGADVNVVAENPTIRVAPIHAAAASGSLPILAALLAHGANPNAQQSGGFTALHEATRTNNLPMIDLLLAHGADPALTNDAGQTAVALATTAGHTEAATRLTSPK